MTAKEIERYLGRVRNLTRKECRLREQINTLRISLLPSCITYDKDKVMTSPADKMLETYSQIDKLERDLHSLLTDIFETRVDILSLLWVLPAKEKAVLRMFYINNKTIQDIAEYLNVTRRHVFRLKNNGINMLAKEIKK